MKIVTPEAAKIRTGHQWLQPFWNWLDTLVALLNVFDGSSWAPVRVMTAAALPSCVYNGTAQTLTASSNGALDGTGIDGVMTLAVGDRVWVNNEGTGSHDGLYVITSLGGASSKWVFTRAPDANTSADFVNGKDFTVGSEGTANKSTRQILTNTTFTLDTTTPAVTTDAGPFNALASVIPAASLSAATKAANAWVVTGQIKGALGNNISAATRVAVRVIAPTAAQGAITTTTGTEVVNTGTPAAHISEATLTTTGAGAFAISVADTVTESVTVEVLVDGGLCTVKTVGPG